MADESEFAAHPNLPAAKLLLGEVREMIADQKAIVETLRTRALALVTVGSVVATFFGSHLPANLSHGQHRDVVIALVAFAVSVVCAMEIVRPRGFRFAFAHTTTLGEMDEGLFVDEYGLSVMRVEGLGCDRIWNEKKIDYMSAILVLACAMVAVQVIAWGVVALA